MECGPKRMREDEQCVLDLVACMHEFDSFPFDPSSPTLHTLQSRLHLMTSFWTSTQPMLQGQKS